MGELLNVIGFSTGLALYAMLLVMVLRAAPDRGGLRHVDPLLLATSLLGLTWNLCVLPAFELPRFGISGPFPVLTAIGFSALGFLPAVVVHSVLRGERDDPRRSFKGPIIGVTYGVSAVAAVLQWQAVAQNDPLPSAAGMQLLTYTYVALLVPLAAVTRRQPGARRALWAAALSIFAVSALHLGQFHQGTPSWPAELIGHHASLPLAFAILYQDFPFALADLFLKRALTLLTLVAVAFVAVVNGGPLLTETGADGAAGVGIFVTLWVATALLYPKLRALTSWFVDTVVLARPDYDGLRAAFALLAQRHDDIPAMLDEACEALSPALSARSVRWREADGEMPAAGESRRSTTIAASLDVPVAEAPRYVVEIGDLSGGRRLLSDDRAFLDAVAAVLGRRIDAIRITHERYERELREREISRLATEAELRALRSQINPHFLFNALTTIGYLIQTAPARAVDTLLRLTSLLRGVLRSEGEFTTLGREIELIEAYLDIERARFEERLRVTIDVPLDLRHERIPPLLLQPLVENAVKHGIAPERHGGEITVLARLAQNGDDGGSLLLTVRDTGAGGSAAVWKRGRAAGVGLANIERRLAGQYGDAAALSVSSTPGLGTSVEIRLPAERHVAELAAGSGAR
ncbi:MAG: sensor histidine kinase [Vicinamibacterales bacterium]